MILNTIYSELALRCNLDSANTTDQGNIRTAVDIAQKNILGRANFWFALKVPTANVLTTVADTAVYVLPYDFHKGLFLRQTSSPVLMEEQDATKFYEETPDPTSPSTGKPTKFIINGLIWASAHPSSASKLSLASTSSSDTTQTVTIRGVASGVDVVEEQTLTGAVAVTSTNTYTQLFSIAKSAATAGTVTATSNAAAVTNVSLLPLQLFKEHWEVRLHLIPDDAYNILGGYYRKPWDMYYDADTLIVPDMHAEAVLSEATSILLFRQGDAKWTSWKQVAEAEFAKLMDVNDWISQDKDERSEMYAS